MKFYLTIFLFTFSFTSFAQDWKTMMYDPSYNFYEVCAEADLYFETIDKEAKGSGWKPYQRWRSENESKFAPSGDRSTVDPEFAITEFRRFLKNNPSSKAIFGAGWKELGPWSIDSITGHYSAGLGRIEDMFIDPNNTNRIYLGSRSGGFWRTLDGGINWIGTTDTLFASGVNAITARPTNTADVLINVQNSSNQYSHGIYRSTNSGDSWTETNFNPTNTGEGGLGTSFRIYDIEYHPTIPNLVFVGTNRGLYRSNDDLQTWTQMFNPAEIYQFIFHPTNASVIYAYDSRSANGNRNKVYISSDAGLTWSFTSDITANSNQTALISASDDCPDCLFFQSSNGVWKSIDQGANFSFISNPGEGRGAYVVSDTDTSVMVLGSIDPFTSIDGGQTFNQSGFWSLGNGAHGGGSLSDNFSQTDVYVHADLRAATSVNGVLYIATDGYLSKSIDDGATWQILSNGTPIRENYTLGISQSNHFCSMIGSQDNGTSILGENGWVEFYGADGMEAIIHPLNPDWMIGSFQYGGRRRTFNRGLTQSGVTPNNQSGSGEGDWVAPLVYNPNNHMEVYHFSDEVWFSEDFGENWEERGSPFSGAVIQRMAIAENNPDVMILSRNGNVQKSDDGGNTFYSVASGLPGASPTDFAFDPKNDSIIFVVYDKYQNDGEKVYRTYNGGQTWTNITYNLGDMPIRSVVIDHSSDANIYLGAEIGVFVMPSSANTWSLYNPGFPNVSVREMEINYGSNTLRAATWGRGMWEYTLKDRIDFPAIMTTEITNPPTFDEPKEDVNQYVTSRISYAGTLSDAYVEWSINAPVFGNVIEMTNTIDSTWVSNSPLPDFPEGTKMYFKVFAVGANGDTSETYKFMYTVRYNVAASLADLTKENVILFPNPNSGQFTVDLNEKEANVFLSILSMDGKKVWKKYYESQNIIEVDVELRKGNYFVVVQSKGTNVVKKMVIE